MVNYKACDKIIITITRNDDDNKATFLQNGAPIKSSGPDAKYLVAYVI